jgi:hypothetical protein
MQVEVQSTIPLFSLGISKSDWSQVLLLAPFDVQKTKRCPAVGAVYGLQLVVVNVTGNEMHNGEWHAVCIAEFGQEMNSRYGLTLDIQKANLLSQVRQLENTF